MILKLFAFYLLFFLTLMLGGCSVEETKEGPASAQGQSSSVASVSSSASSQSVSSEVSSSSEASVSTSSTQSSSSTVQENNTSAVSNVVRVERGNVLGAHVTDARGRVAVQPDPARPEYAFAQTPVPPIVAEGGWVDINADGIRNGFDFNLTIRMHSCDGKVITPLTSLAAETCRVDDVHQIYDAFKDIIGSGVSEGDFFSQTASERNETEFTLLTNAAFRALMRGERSYAAVLEEYTRLKSRAEALLLAFPATRLSELIEIESSRDLDEILILDGALEQLLERLRSENCPEGEVLMPVPNENGYDPAALTALLDMPKMADLLAYSTCHVPDCEAGYIARNGECVEDVPVAPVAPGGETDVCTQEYAPVCGTRGGTDRTYSNLCMLESDGAELHYTGECVVCASGETFNEATYSCDEAPQECPAVYDPVCGALEGVIETYSNQCTLDAAGAVKLLDDACEALTCPAGEVLSETYHCEPLSCAVTEVFDPDTNSCIPKTCDPGFVLQGDGSCRCANAGSVFAMDASSCESFADECSVPDGWSIVDECPAEPITYSVTDNPSDITAAHNFYRAEVFSGSQLSWDASLAQDAQDWADYLAVNYTDEVRNSGVAPHASTFQPELHEFDLFQGENIYMTTLLPVQVAMVTAVEAFASEKAYYHYDSNSCDSGRVCGHYTQVVWKNTSRVGCAEAQLLDNTFKTVVVCRYYMPGNYVGQKPY